MLVDSLLKSFLWLTVSEIKESQQLLKLMIDISKITFTIRVRIFLPNRNILGDTETLYRIVKAVSGIKAK